MIQPKNKKIKIYTIKKKLMTMTFISGKIQFHFQSHHNKEKKKDKQRNSNRHDLEEKITWICKLSNLIISHASQCILVVVCS